MDGHLPAAHPPLVLGHEIAGTVVAVGTRVERVHIGDRVTIDQVVGCGECIFCRRGSRQFCTTGYELGMTADGGCQGFIVVPQKNVFSVPATISDEAAAILDMEVWAAVSKCGVGRGEAVLVLGPGPAGLIACQIAKVFGAGRVILAGPNSMRMKKAQELGFADAYVFSDEEDVASRVLQMTCGLRGRCGD